MKSSKRLLFMFTLALFGLFVSGYLAFAYMKVVDLVCTDSGCDAIRGWHDQRLPRAALPFSGILYFLVLSVLTYRIGVVDPKGKGPLVKAVAALGTLGALVMVGLFSVEVRLHAYCFWCMLVAGTTLLFCLLSLLEWRSWTKGGAQYELDFEPFLKWGLVPVIIGILMVSTLEKSESVPNPAPVPEANAPSGNVASGNLPGGNNPVSPPGGGNEIAMNPTSGDASTASVLSIFNTFNPVRKPDDAEISQRLKSVQLIPAGAHIKGAKKAKVTLVEFADPGCIHCADQAPEVDMLLKKYPKDLRLVYRHFPLRSHMQSPLAAEAMESAGAQGKFFEMRDLLFHNLGMQEEPDLARYAQQLGLNMAQFKKDMSTHKYAARVRKDRTDADAIGIRSTPTLIFNNYVYSGPLRLSTLDLVMKALLGKEKPVKTS